MGVLAVLKRESRRRGAAVTSSRRWCWRCHSNGNVGGSTDISSVCTIGASVVLIAVPVSPVPSSGATEEMVELTI